MIGEANDSRIVQKDPLLKTGLVKGHHSHCVISLHLEILNSQYSSMLIFIENVTLKSLFSIQQLFYLHFKWLGNGRFS